MNCTFEGCPNEATFSYSWPWGEDGCACATHRIVLTQQSEQLRRPVSVSPLQPGLPRPVTRDERLGYTSRIAALEAELQELQGRAVTIQHAHAELARQSRTDKASQAVLQRELQEARERAADLAQSLELCQRDRTAARADLERMRAHQAALDPEIPFGQTSDGRT